MEIVVTEANLIELIKKAYELSVPLGMGFFHFTEGSLTDEEAKAMIVDDSFCPISLDYIRGRSCKMNVYKKEGELIIRAPWYDHTTKALKELLTVCMPAGYVLPEGLDDLKHNVSCECSDCKIGRA